MTTRFEQAKIPVQNEPVFQVLRGALEQALSPAGVERFLGKLQSKKLNVVRMEAILQARLLEGVDAAALYAQLPVSDQGLLREWYLTRVDAIELPLREKYHKVFRTY